MNASRFRSELIVSLFGLCAAACSRNLAVLDDTTGVSGASNGVSVQWPGGDGGRAGSEHNTDSIREFALIHQLGKEIGHALFDELCFGKKFRSLFNSHFTHAHVILQLYIQFQT